VSFFSGFREGESVGKCLTLRFDPVSFVTALLFSSSPRFFVSILTYVLVQVLLGRATPPFTTPSAQDVDWLSPFSFDFLTCRFFSGNGPTHLNTGPFLPFQCCFLHFLVSTCNLLSAAVVCLPPDDKRFFPDLFHLPPFRNVSFPSPFSRQFSLLSRPGDSDSPIFCLS